MRALIAAFCFAGLLVAGGAAAQSMRPNSQGIASSLVCLISGGAGCTMTGDIVLNSAAPTITTGTNKDLTLAPNGSGSINLNGDSVALYDAAGTARGYAICTSTACRWESAGSNAGSIKWLAAGAVITGTRNDAAIGTKVFGVSDSVADASDTNLWSVDGVGITQWITNVSASNNLAGTSACAASGDVGKIALYNDTSTSKISFCACQQTGAGTFAWAAIGAGDCT